VTNKIKIKTINRWRGLVVRADENKKLLTKKIQK